MLAKDKSSHVRRDVAQNPHTPAGALAGLANDMIKIRRAVAENPNTSAETLVKLLKDKVSAIRTAVKKSHPEIDFNLIKIVEHLETVM